MKIENRVVVKATIDGKDIKIGHPLMNDFRWEMIKDRAKIAKKIFESCRELCGGSYGQLREHLSKVETSDAKRDKVFDIIRDRFDETEIMDAYLFLNEYLPRRQNVEIHKDGLKEYTDTFTYADRFELENEKVVTDYCEMFEF